MLASMARLQDFYDFMTFAQEDFGEASLRRWERYRKDKVVPR